jgi:hypothetical protein
MTDDGLTGHPAEKCEVCREQATHVVKMGIFEILFCDEHYGGWCSGMSIARMKERLCST